MFFNSQTIFIFRCYWCLVLDFNLKFCIRVYEFHFLVISKQLFWQFFSSHHLLMIFTINSICTLVKTCKLVSLKGAATQEPIHFDDGNIHFEIYIVFENPHDDAQPQIIHVYHLKRQCVLKKPKMIGSPKYYYSFQLFHILFCLTYDIISVQFSFIQHSFFFSSCVDYIFCTHIYNLFFPK